MGTLLAVNAANVIDLRIYTGGDTSLRESPPTQRIRNGQLLETTSLELPSDLGESRELLKPRRSALKLNDLPDAQKIKTLKSYFQKNFKYTTHLRTTSDAGQSALSKFLTESQEGHCEYFATATTLVLRAAGVPSRYVVGYAVREQSNTAGEYLLRGSHAHAWCRAYLGGKKEIVEEEQIINLGGGRERTVTISREIWSGGQWTDVDLTPATWFAIDAPSPNLKERLADRFQRLKEDFPALACQRTQPRLGKPRSRHHRNRCRCLRPLEIERFSHSQRKRTGSKWRSTSSKNEPAHFDFAPTGRDSWQEARWSATVRLAARSSP